ncbi:MAG: prepilin-type N-terminal cleavage/methylation domain-containing protein [Halieaceae bacterium]
MSKPLSKSNHRRGTQGFSLLEMMVAITILSLSLGVMYQAVSGATRNVRADEKYAFGVELARSLLAQNIMVPRAGVSKRGETSGGYRWEVNTSPIDAQVRGLQGGSLQEIEIMVAWNDGRGTKEFILDSVVEGVGK